MIKISCYKTTPEKLSRAFCNLAEKCYHSAIKVFVYTNSKEQAFELDTVLWIYSRKQFIPHGTIYDTWPEKQPILIGSELKNFKHPNKILISTKADIYTYKYIYGISRPKNWFDRLYIPNKIKRIKKSLKFLLNDKC